MRLGRALTCDARRVEELPGLGAPLAKRANVLHAAGVVDDDAPVDKVGHEQLAHFRAEALDEGDSHRAPEVRRLLGAVVADAADRCALGPSVLVADVDGRGALAAAGLAAASAGGRRSHTGTFQP